MASATVTVLPAACTGGATWNGTACACSAGQYQVDGQCYTPLPANHCGTDRWAIKTGTDAGVAQVMTTSAVATAIGNLVKVARPASLSPTLRSEPVETRVYGLDATLVSYRFNEDSDYDLTVADGTGKTMIVSIPHPDCVAVTSPFRPAIIAARAAINGRLMVAATAKSASMPMRVFGIGLFNSTSRIGAAPNLLELHPLLKVEFSPTGPVTSDTTYPPIADYLRVFNWAEAAYPQYFPKPGTAGTYQQYSYRYYAKTDTYLGTASGRVILHNGKDWNLLDVGAIGDFLPIARDGGY